jgi:hypothetical protein
MKMRKYLIPEKGNFYKANLHSHTNFSDGALTPEEVKQAYKSRGYAINAFTDHEILWNHYEALRDDEFLPLVATEIGVNDQRLPFAISSSVHLSLFSRDPYEDGTPFRGKKNLEWLVSENYITQEMVDSRKWTGIIDNEGEQYAAKINEIIRVAKEKGFIVSLNHPSWSLLNKGEHLAYEGVWGVEVYNSSCVRMGYDDTEQPLFDLLSKGEQVHPLVGDDWHGGEAVCGRSCVWVGAERLEYDAVISALRRGDFYSSTGPEIYELSIDDGVLSVDCSDAERIVVSTERRRIRTVYATDGNPIRHAELDLGDLIAENQRIEEKYKEHGKKRRTYIRVTVKDKSGACAYTRAYFLNELTPS